MHTFQDINYLHNKISPPLSRGDILLYFFSYVSAFFLLRAHNFPAEFHKRVSAFGTLFNGMFFAFLNGVRLVPQSKRTIWIARAAVKYFSSFGTL